MKQSEDLTVKVLADFLDKLPPEAKVTLRFNQNFDQWELLISLTELTYFSVKVRMYKGVLA